MPHLRTLVALAPVATAATLSAPAVAAAPTRYAVADIVVAADYATSHVAYAVGAEQKCRTACSRLLRSTDGGVTWTPAPAHGWPGGTLVSTATGSGEMLLSAS